MIPHRAEGVLVQEAHGETVLLRLDDGSYYSTDEVGSFIWSVSDGARDVDAVVDAVCDEFDAPRDLIRVDVDAFFADLAAEGLVELRA